MLPFLKRQEAAVVTPADTVTRKPDEGAELNPLEIAAEELIEAVHAKDKQGVIEALQAILDLTKHTLE